MSFKERVYDFLYNYFFIALFSLFLFLEIYDFFYPAWINKTSLLFLLLFSGVFCVFIILFRKIGIFLFPAISLVVTIVMYVADPVTTITFINEKNLLLLFVLCLGAFFLFLLSERTLLYEIILALGAIAYLVYMTLIGTNPHPLSPAIVLTYALMVLVRFKQHRKSKVTRERSLTYVFFLLPFFIVFMSILMLLPYPDKPINSTWLLSRFYRLQDLFHSNSGTIFFTGTNKMTYDNTSDLSLENAEIIMTITNSDPSFDGEIYLQGAQFNSFEDGDWYNTVPDDTEYMNYDAFMAMMALYREGYDLSAMYKPVTPLSLDVTYQAFVSDSLFVPAKALVNISPFEDFKNLKNRGLNPKLEQKESYGFSYSINYISTNYSEFRKSMFKNSFDDVSSPLVRARDYFNSIKLQNITPDSLEKYNRFIYDNYAKPFQVDSEVRNWIDKNINTKSDALTCLLSMEQAFSKKYYDSEYKEYPSSLKSENDFLHYFLLDNDEGFCVHYATAFCLLARHLGFPARVVQGYKVPVHGTNPAPVFNCYGHSWVEIYFDSFGWIIFDPTSARDAAKKDDDSYEPILASNKTAITSSFNGGLPSKNFSIPAGSTVELTGSKFTEDIGVNDAIIAEITEMEDGSTHISFINKGDTQSNPNHEPSNDLAEPSYNLEEIRNSENLTKESENRFKLRLIILIIVIVAIIITLLIILTVRAKRKNKDNRDTIRVKEDENNQITIRYINEIKKCIAILQALDLTRISSETLEEFSNRIHEEFVDYLSNDEDEALPEDETDSSSYRIANESKNTKLTTNNASVTKDLPEIDVPTTRFLNSYQNYIYGEFEPIQDTLKEVLVEKKTLLALLKSYNKRLYFMTKTKLLFIK